jgi:hypothetical protein
MKGKPGFPFPKSRKLVIEGGEPALPMGWVGVRAWGGSDKDGATRAPAAKAGERVRARLLAERSKKGKWMAQIEGGASGTVDGDAPEGVAAGKVVELVVKNTAAQGQPWNFAWPKRG